MIHKLSDLEKQGFKNNKENINSHWFALLGFNYEIFDNLYCYIESTLARSDIIFESDNFTDKQIIWLNNFRFGIKIKTVI